MFDNREVVLHQAKNVNVEHQKHNGVPSDIRQDSTVRDVTQDYDERKAEA